MTTQTAHFEILPKHPSVPEVKETFATHDEAYDFLVSDPLLSGNAHHPFFFGNFFEIALCGGDGCTK